MDDYREFKDIRAAKEFIENFPYEGHRDRVYFFGESDYLFSNDGIRGLYIGGYRGGFPLDKIALNFEYYHKNNTLNLLIIFHKKVIDIKGSDCVILKRIHSDGVEILSSLSDPVEHYKSDLLCDYDESDFKDLANTCVIRYPLSRKCFDMLRYPFSSFGIEIVSRKGILKFKTEFSGIASFFELFCEKIDKHFSGAVNTIKWALNNRSFDDDEKNLSCFVYLMQDMTNGRYKIGMSNKPEYREKTLQSEKPEIKLLCFKKFDTRKQAKTMESMLHNMFKEKRIRGEWFGLTSYEVGAVKRMLY